MQNKLFMLAFAILLTGCASDNFLTSAVGLSEDQLVANSVVAVQKMDTENQVAPEDNPYAKRLRRITKGLDNYNGMDLNYEVYLTDEVNAFATPDGSIRIYSGLMDVMDDEQVLAVVGHEIGHVALKHSLVQMRQSFMTNVGFQVLSSVGGNVGALSDSQLGSMMNGFLHARYSQSDEFEADAYAVTFLNDNGNDPLAMKEAIEVLRGLYGDSADFFGTHPSNPQRIVNIEKAAAGL